MVSQKVKVKCLNGIEPYKANEIVQKMIKYRSAVKILYKNNIIDARSILTILGASIKVDEEILIECSGDDEQEALDMITRIAMNA